MFLFLFFHRTWFPAQLAGRINPSGVLDKSWSYVKSVVPLGTCHTFRTLASSFPLRVDFHFFPKIALLLLSLSATKEGSATCTILARAEIGISGPLLAGLLFIR